VTSHSVTHRHGGYELYVDQTKNLLERWATKAASAPHISSGENSGVQANHEVNAN